MASDSPVREQRRPGRALRKPSEVINELHAKGLYVGRGIYSDAAGVYTCTSCGHEWRPYDRRPWWPIRVMWDPRLTPFKKRSFLSRHGVQIGWDGLDQRVFQTVIGIGPIVFLFGNDRA